MLCKAMISADCFNRPTQNRVSRSTFVVEDSEAMVVC